MRHYFILVILFLGFIQCKESKSSANPNTSTQNSIQHAEGFSIEKYDGFSVVKVSNAYPEAKDDYTYVLHKKGVENTVIGFPTTQYISSEKTRALIDAGKVRDLGSNQGLNTEVILDIQPDVIVGFSVDGDLKTYKNLEKNG